VRLWVVFADTFEGTDEDDSEAASMQWVHATWDATGLGRDDVLLAVATSNGRYAYLKSRDMIGGLPDEFGDDLQSALKGSYPRGAIAAANDLDSPGVGPGPPTQTPPPVQLHAPQLDIAARGFLDRLRDVRESRGFFDEVQDFCLGAAIGLVLAVALGWRKPADHWARRHRPILRWVLAGVVGFATFTWGSAVLVVTGIVALGVWMVIAGYRGRTPKGQRALVENTLPARIEKKLGLKAASGWDGKVRAKYDKAGLAVWLSITLPRSDAPQEYAGRFAEVARHLLGGQWTPHPATHTLTLTRDPVDAPLVIPFKAVLREPKMLGEDVAIVSFVTDNSGKTGHRVDGAVLGDQGGSACPRAEKRYQKPVQGAVPARRGSRLGFRLADPRQHVRHQTDDVPAENSAHRADQIHANGGRGFQALPAAGIPHRSRRSRQPGLLADR
jgi:hypothetical protein